MSSIEPALEKPRSGLETGGRGDQSIRLISARPSLRQKLVELWRYRQLLLGLIRREIKVKYKDSILGFLWSMLNPALTLGVYYFVFQIVLKNGIPYFAFFLMSGLLVWNLFQAAVPGGTGSIVGNAGIIKKVSFPREILPLATVGTALVFFFFQSIVLAVFLIAFSYSIDPAYIPAVLLALVTLLVFTSALAIFLSAVNVYLRDVAHFIELILLAWFWGTPIVYPYELIAVHLHKFAILYDFLNPITPIVLTFQRAFYNKVSPNTPAGILHILPPGVDMGWYIYSLLGILIVSIGLFFVALMVFGRLEGNFAEEL